MLVRSLQHIASDAVVLCADLGAQCRPALPCCVQHEISTALQVLDDVKDYNAHTTL